MTKRSCLPIALTLLLIALLTGSLAVVAQEFIQRDDATHAPETASLFSNDPSCSLPGSEYRNTLPINRGIIGFGSWLLLPPILALIIIYLFYIASAQTGYHLFLKRLFIPHSIHAPPRLSPREGLSCLCYVTPH